MNLDGAHAVITGGSKGVGAALARRLANDGAKVSIIARKSAELDLVEKETGGVAFPTDLADLDQVAGLIERIEAAQGPVDVLALNAATVASGPFESLTAQQLQRTITVNLLAPLELGRQALAGMVARRRGVVMTTGTLGAEATVMHLGSYNPAKIGLAKWSVDLESELRDTGVRVFTVIIGRVKDTELVNAASQDPVVAFFEQRAGEFGILTPERVAGRMAELVAGDRRGAVVTIPRTAAPLVLLRHLPARLLEPLVGRPGRRIKREQAALQPQPNLGSDR